MEQLEPACHDPRVKIRVDVFDEVLKEVKEMMFDALPRFLESEREGIVEDMLKARRR